MLQLHDVTVRYEATTAVMGVSLEVADGEVLALLGPSGCGKSTLLRAIVGLEPLAAGRVQWDGVDLVRVPVHRRGFGLMFQDGVLFPHRTVAGNVGYGLGGWANRRRLGRWTNRRRLGGSADGRSVGGWVNGRSGSFGTPRSGGGRPDSTERVTELLQMVGLAGYGARRVSTLSGGEAQRVALARALAPRPRLLLLDEPLAALDMSLRATLLADLDEVLRSTGTTAVFVTHDQNEAFAIADRVALMREGRIVQVGTPRQVRDNPADAEAARFLGVAESVESDSG